MIELFRQAESHETAAELGIASGSAIFETALRRLPVTEALRRRSCEDPEDHRAIARRIDDLASRAIDRRHLHPHDISLAIYLWVLRSLDRRRPPARRLSESAATAVLTAPNCSWAHRLARGILTDATDHDR